MHHHQNYKSNWRRHTQKETLFWKMTGKSKGWIVLYHTRLGLLTFATSNQSISFKVGVYSDMQICISLKYRYGMRINFECTALILHKTIFFKTYWSLTSCMQYKHLILKCSDAIQNLDPSGLIYWFGSERYSVLRYIYDESKL